MEQKLTIKWNNHVLQVADAFEVLKNDEDLVDVTLSCEGKKLKAHKMLLSACSPYFHDVFRDNPCQHPVIVFRDFKFVDLVAIIDFMYKGEVDVKQEDFESFLEAAEMLEVKGLSGKAKQNITQDGSSSSPSQFLESEINQPSCSEDTQNIALSDHSRASFKRKKAGKIQTQAFDKKPKLSVSNPISLSGIVKEESLEDLTFDDDDVMDDLHTAETDMALSTIGDILPQRVLQHDESVELPSIIEAEENETAAKEELCYSSKSNPEPFVGTDLPKNDPNDISTTMPIDLVDTVKNTEKYLTPKMRVKESNRSSQKELIQTYEMPKIYENNFAMTTPSSDNNMESENTSDNAQSDNIPTNNKPSDNESAIAEEAPDFNEVPQEEEEEKKPEFDYFGCETCKAEAKPVDIDNLVLTHKCPICPFPCFCAHLLKDHMKYIHGWFNVQRRFAQY